MIRLPSSSGYPIDLRNPGRDEVAYDLSVKYFGKESVDKILSTKHRSQITKEALIADLMQYDRSYAPILRDPTYTVACRSVLADFSSHTKLIPLTLGGSMKHPVFPKDRSPGFHWKLRGFETKGDELLNSSSPDDDPSEDLPLHSLIRQHTHAEYNTGTSDRPFTSSELAKAISSVNPKKAPAQFPKVPI
ncbi:hypothetical protein RUM43_009247, partial [Polyplax serrata]